jgi:hypothetical protein
VRVVGLGAQKLNRLAGAATRLVELLSLVVQSGVNRRDERGYLECQG